MYYTELGNIAIRNYADPLQLGAASSAETHCHGHINHLTTLLREEPVI
jgi:hypothetical protein